MTTTLEDLRQIFRGLARTPGFTALAATTIAIGIGATTAVFSVANEVMFRPLGVRDPGSLVMLWESNAERGWNQVQVAAGNAAEWRQRVAAFEDVAIVRENTDDVSLATADRPVTVRVGEVSGNTFSLLGAVPVLGRLPRWEEGFQGQTPLVVLSHQAWTRVFAGDTGMVGRSIRLDGRDAVIAGVLAPSFRYPVNDAEVWITFRWNPALLPNGIFFRQAHVFRAMARLRDDVSAETAAAELAAVARSIADERPRTNRGMEAGLTGLHEFLVGERGFPLLLLLGAVGLLQLIVCANVANLLLARSLARRQEMAVRVALGAGRSRITKLVLTESLALAAIGALLGLGLGAFGLDAIAWLRPEDLPAMSFRLDWRMLAVTSAVACGSALLFGVQPALASGRVDIAGRMSEGQRAGTGRGGQVASHALTTLEVALAVMLVTGAGLMLRSIAKLRQVEPGVNTAGVLTFQVRPPAGTYRTDSARTRFAELLIDALRGTPGVREVGAGRSLPFMGVGWSSDFTVEGWPSDRFGVEVRHREVTPGYFRALQVPVRSGELFAEIPRMEMPYPVVVNEAFASRYFSGDSPVGRRITFNRVPDSTSTWYVVTGVVGNERMQLNVPPVPEIIGHLAYDTPGEMRFAVKADGDPLALVPGIRSALAGINPEVSLMKVRTMDAVARDALAADRYLLVLLGVFGTAALVLAAVGVYGVSAQVARSRRREVGIRLALGATTMDVARALARRGLVFTGTGVVLGVAGALAGGSVMRRLLFGVAPGDAVTLVLVAALLAVVALAATLLPAYRASKLDPVEVLGAD